MEIVTSHLLFSQIREFVIGRLDEYVGSEDEATFFTSAERAHLLEICLESVQYNKVSACCIFWPQNKNVFAEVFSRVNSVQVWL